MADWIKILKEQSEAGDRMGQEVPQMLANPDISVEQVKALFKALEEQAEFTEKLKLVLEANDFDPEVIVAAERLEERYIDLAAEAAEKWKALLG